MKRLILMLLMLVAVPALADSYYKVNVRRVESNLYRDSNSGLYIVTRYCYEYAFMDDAILKYDAYSYDNKLIFSSGTSCDVDKLLRD